MIPTKWFTLVNDGSRRECKIKIIVVQLRLIDERILQVSVTCPHVIFGEYFSSFSN